MNETTTTPSLNFTQTIVWATVLASAILFVSTASLAWVVPGGFWNGVAIGLFCAFWGGLGFGVMVGGTAHILSADSPQAGRDVPSDARSLEVESVISVESVLATEAASPERAPLAESTEERHAGVLR